MVDLKINFNKNMKYKKESWMCKCLKIVESQRHVLLHCPENSKLREGRDKAKFLQDVLAIQDAALSYFNKATFQS